MPTTPGTIQDLVDAFARDIRQLTDPSTKEATLRLKYLDPFFRLLGWPVGDAGALADQEVVIEPSIDVVEGARLRSRRPDYLFKIDFPRFTCEAKKPSVDLDLDRDAIFQAKRDAWNLQIPFTVLTDFQQFRVYETTRTPVHSEPGVGLVRDLCFDFGDYPTQWDVITATFSRDAVATGSLEALRARLRRAPAGRRLRTVDRMLIDLRGDEPVNNVFLAFLERHRQHLAAAIYRDNRTDFPDAATPHGAARLTEAVQRILDRIVFIRVCEDRNVIPWAGLRELLDRVSEERGELYPSLCARFQEFNQTFNGYLYKPHFSETLKIEGGVLADFIRALYPPDAPWNFATMGDDLLARVYERFLGNTITVNHARVEVTEKPEVQHANGVYYTPRFIVDSILRRVVAPKLAGKAPADVLPVKILDPACGSGSFLVVAFQSLIDHCRAAITADPSLASHIPPGKRKPRKIAFQDAAGKWQLMPEFRAELLTSCIHGVDIDQQAVEVTIMSLYLKMLEVPLPPNWQADLLGGNRLLPPLDNNIRCGNSLIDQKDLDEYATELHGGLFAGDDNVRFRINAFDWTSESRGFGRVLRGNRTGFDCIIGNPPYIRVQELNKWAPEECQFYKWAYKSAERGNYEIYVVFVERGLKLLAPDGLLGFIMPHKWWQAAYGAGLRAIVAEGGYLRNVLDFGHGLVFHHAAVYTAIQVFGLGPRRDSVAFSRIETLDDGAAQCTAIDSGGTIENTTTFFSAHPPASGSWEFMNSVKGDRFRLVGNATSDTLESVAARMSQGIRTSCNEVFVLRVVDAKRNRYFSEQLSREVQLESKFLRPFLGAESIRRYEIVTTDKVVIVPYEPRDRRMKLVAASEIETDTPMLWSYLKQNETVLRARERGRFDDDDWYCFGRNQNIDLINVPKLLVPDIVNAGAFGLDAQGQYAFVSGYGITYKPEYESHATLILGLLNSTLLSEYLRAISTPLRRGWFRTFPQFMGRLPIKLPATAAERKLADRVEESVRQVTAAKKRLRNAGLSDRDRSQQEQIADAAERRIDADVMTLYGVDALPE